MVTVMIRRVMVMASDEGGDGDCYDAEGDGDGDGK